MDTNCYRKVDVSLPGKGNSNSHGARPVLLIITMLSNHHDDKVDSDQQIFNEELSLSEHLGSSNMNSCLTPRESLLVCAPECVCVCVCVWTRVVPASGTVPRRKH